MSLSDDYRVEIINGNMVSFIFDGIFLAPQIDDEEGSNGYVAFQVRSNNDLELGDCVENTAAIFFDFNAPIITNTVTTTVVETLGLDKVSLINSITIYPNPTSQLLKIETNNLTLNNAIIRSISGKTLQQTSNNQIDVSTLAIGV